MAADFGIMADGPHMFSVSGELDIATVPLMNVAIAHAVSQGGPITIDMSFLTFMDSTGVGGDPQVGEGIGERLHRSSRRS